MAWNQSTGDDTGPAPGGGARERSPVFPRNGPVITSHLQSLLADATGDVLEIGSGAGQHIAAFAAALPSLTWWPTEADRPRLASIEAWRHHAGLPNLRPPAQLDAAALPWRPDPPGAPLDGGLAAVIAVNVVHISPWAVACGIMAGAGRHLAAGGHLVLYGPFLQYDVPTAPSNLAFDRQLRAQDPSWGLRRISDLDSLAAENGLTRARITTVPANNLILEFRKPA